MTRFHRLRAPITPMEIHRARARAGTEVVVASMPGFAGVHGVLAARYGSRDVALPDGRPVPPGTAHFLEHEMFQKSDGDLFDRFEARGASANAYTTFSSTAYLFTSPGDLGPNLDDLLAGLESLEVDEALVAREKAIIGQEIALYDDDPSWRGYFDLLGAMYHRHPLRLDIAGTSRTIRRIDVDLLRAVHEAYYDPANLVLVVAGDVDPGEVLGRVDRHFPGRARAAPRHAAWGTEPPEVRTGRVRRALDVSRPHVHLGIKEVPAKRRDARLRRQIEAALVLDVLFGTGGTVEAPLYQEGVVDESFGAGHEAEEDYVHSVVSAEVDDPRAYRRRLERAWNEAVREGMDPERVERSKRRAVGRFLRTFNATESVAQWLLGHALEKVPLEVRWRLLRDATPRALERRLAALHEAPRAWAIVVPRA